MMKVLVLAVLLAVFAGACSTSKSAETEKVPAEPTTETTTATSDQTEPAGEDADTEEPTAGAETSAADVLPNDGTREVGDITKCPVSGDVFTVAAETPKVEYEGGTYYLCCKGCIDKFEADPAKFLTADASDASDETGGHEHGHGHHHH